MNYDYFAHEADMGIIGRGQTVEQAFIQAAKAVFAYMVDINQVKINRTVRFHFQEQDTELALVTWLNTLLAEARQAGMIFSEFKLRRENDNWCGQASGELWNDSLERGTEVKGATLTMLSVQEKDHLWEARCVVDV